MQKCVTLQKEGTGKKEKKKKGLCAIGFKSNNCMHVWIRVIVQIFEPLCARVCVHVHLHNEWGARQQQLGMPSSVLLSSINDQSGPSGEREPPTTKTWHWTNDTEKEKECEDRSVNSKSKSEMGQEGGS